jgi:uncharacterized protein (DUF305 family)
MISQPSSYVSKRHLLVGMKSTHALTALLLLVTMVTSSMSQQSSHGSKSADDPAWSELSESMGKMHRTMAAVKPSGDADVDFINLMLPHHQAAIDMAKSQLMHGADPQMRRLAQEIITDQQSEIELMQLWLKRHSSGSQPTQEK